MELDWATSLELFGFAFAAAGLGGLVCPLVGNLLLLRRTSFQAIALPQSAAAGIVLGFALGTEPDLGGAHGAHLATHAVWAVAATAIALLFLSRTGRGRGAESGRVAALFAASTAAIYLFGQLSPVGRAHVDDLLRGEILGTGPAELRLLGGTLLAVLAVLVLCGRELYSVSFDPDHARVLGLPVVRYELAWAVLVGATVAAGTLVLGPTLSFGLLVLPSVAALRWARSVRELWWLAPGFGLFACLGGTVLSLEVDLPLGASIVAVACVAPLVPGRRTGRGGSGAA